MEWSDEAIILGLRPLGENGAILEALTREHGRHLGLVRGASSKRIKGTLERGNAVKVQWRARLDQQLGSFTVELAAARAAHFFDDALKLAGLSSACAVAAATLPERENHTRVYEALDALLNTLAITPSPDWVTDYVRFEVVLLEDLGFGLDLASCAATGVTDRLTHVSPKTGRAVSEGAAAPYRARLLVLPAFLAPGDEAASVHDLVDGLALTGFFLERAVVETHSGAMPPARARLCERLAAGAPAR
ncbi:MAG: DNA repair protein RecO [Alphaproteobacteria bacterium]|nr:DNA repair protein RecO [Alphaproteobacteria bacterium]